MLSSLSKDEVALLIPPPESRQCRVVLFVGHASLNSSVFGLHNARVWFVQVLPVFPRLVDLPPDKFQAALARILQVFRTFSSRCNSTHDMQCSLCIVRK